MKHEDYKKCLFARKNKLTKMNVIRPGVWTDVLMPCSFI